MSLWRRAWRFPRLRRPPSLTVDFLLAVMQHSQLQHHMGLDTAMLPNMTVMDRQENMSLTIQSNVPIGVHKTHIAIATGSTLLIDKKNQSANLVCVQE